MVVLADVRIVRSASPSTPGTFSELKGNVKLSGRGLAEPSNLPILRWKALWYELSELTWIK